jgi:hypothetical protein
VQRPEFRDYLASALALLARETPLAYQAVAHALDGVALRVRVGGAPFVVSFARGAHAFANARAHADADVASDVATLLDLVDGRVSLVPALRSERIALRGSVAVIARFDRALTAFFAGAVRGESFPGLLADFRSRGTPEEA